MKDLSEALDEANMKRQEGIMVKNPTSNYILNERTDDCIKVKLDYLDTLGDSLDLLIIGADYGVGKRSNAFGSFMCGLRDSNAPEGKPRFLSFCRFGTGFSMKENEQLRNLEGWTRLDPKKIPDWLVVTFCFGALSAVKLNKTSFYRILKRSVVVQVKAAEIVPAIVKDYNKTDLERMIKEHGGKFFQHPDASPNIRIIADSLKPTKQEFIKRMDRHGDSYTDPVDADSLKEIFEMISVDEGTPETENEKERKRRQLNDDIERRYFKGEGLPTGLFRHHVVHIDYPPPRDENDIDDLWALQEGCRDRLKLVESILRYHDAQIATDPYSNKITHVIFDEKDLSRISVPILEFSHVFERTLGQDSDIVGKELYSFLDKDGHLTLRPEGTAGEHVLLPRTHVSTREASKRKVKAGENLCKFSHNAAILVSLFEQFGIEMFGHEGPTSDIEVIDMAWSFLNKIGITGAIELEINSLGDVESRMRYRDVIRDYLRHNEVRLSEESVKRISTNPLRVLDSKNSKDALVIQNCPLITEYYSSKSAESFEVVCQGLQRLGIPYKINPRLVRGLDYYENTIFEFKCDHASLGTSQGTILAGGRYDGLVHLMGGKERVPGIGYDTLVYINPYTVFLKLIDPLHDRWAAGIDRLALILDESFVPLQERPVAVIVIPNRDEPSSDDFNEKHNKLDYHGLSISRSLRLHNIKTLFYHEPQSARKSNLKAALGYILKAGASHAILIGEDEVERGEVLVKYLDSKIQKGVKIENVVNAITESKKEGKQGF
ncbi:485_t:CDS:10 [Acaulospora colombiana]|uniref:485_t:CDS:1 n=1 Tax=Acaulospora colombiana TaxID=27376 RepID=A0ACA9KT75_9GLOM|nr:485_t:CDS:10 [Acaulospora colombiana]